MAYLKTHGGSLSASIQNLQFVLLWILTYILIYKAQGKTKNGLKDFWLAQGLPI
jgi:hypothetical protein